MRVRGRRERPAREEAGQGLESRGSEDGAVASGVAPAEPELTEVDEHERPAVDADERASGDEAEGDTPASDEPGHARGGLRVPDGYATLEGGPDGGGRAVAVVVSRFNGELTARLLEEALGELERRRVAREAVMVVPVPGAFELPLAAMALAKTRRYACVVALGCVIRGETPHFDFVAGEAASGLQLAALETGVPIGFGVLTVDHAAQAEVRVAKGAEAVRTALEMADVFARLRTVAAASR